MDKYEQVMEILKDEHDKELECVHVTKELMKHTLNPIRRIRMKDSCKMFIDHAIGIELAIHRIQREIEP